MFVEAAKWILLLPFLFSVTYQIPTSPEALQIQKQYSKALEAILGVGIRLQAVLEDPRTPENKNFLVSPISVTVSIAQLILAAEGESRDNLYYLLSLPTTKDDQNTLISYFHQNSNFTYVLPYAKLHLQLGALLRALVKDAANKSFQLSTSSAWFLNKEINLKREFQQNLAIYQSEIYKMNYTEDPNGSKDFINKWAYDHTDHLIEKVLQTPLPLTTSAVFMNAIHFLAEWETPFSNELNINGPFQVSPEKQVNVTYMRGFLENILYIEDKDKKIKMMGLPYKNGELTMYIIMPNEDHEHKFQLKKFVRSLKASEILEMVTAAKHRQVAVTLPKMELSSTMSILEPLEKFLEYKVKENQKKVNANLSTNVVDALENKVEEFVTFRSTDETEIRLTGATEKGNFKLTNMLQQMILTVNEKGTEAAAITMSIIDYIGGSKSFKVDRPFTFFIRHELTSATLFWGTIVDPSQKS